MRVSERIIDRIVRVAVAAEPCGWVILRPAAVKLPAHNSHHKRRQIQSTNGQTLSPGLVKQRQVGEAL